MTNNKQQTAVEWYIIKRDEIEMKIRLMQISPSEYEQELIKAEQQAKEMDKERMIGFTNKYINSELWVNCNAIESDSTVEQYYEKTYGGGEQ
jgi:hypothetical protein